MTIEGLLKVYTRPMVSEDRTEALKHFVSSNFAATIHATFEAFQAYNFARLLKQL